MRDDVGARGCHATAGEIATFGSALLRSNVIGERGRRELFTAVPLAGGIGISSWLFIHPGVDLVVALVANVNTAPVGGEPYRRIAAAFRSDALK